MNAIEELKEIVAGDLKIEALALHLNTSVKFLEGWLRGERDLFGWLPQIAAYYGKSLVIELEDIPCRTESVTKSSTDPTPPTSGDSVSPNSTVSAPDAPSGNAAAPTGGTHQPTSPFAGKSSS